MTVRLPSNPAVACLTCELLVLWSSLCSPVLKANAASTGTVVAWGQNSSGQTAVPVAAQNGVTAIAAGSYYTLALKNTGVVVAWGYNSDGETNVPVAAQSGVVAIAAGGYHAVALKNDGTVTAWGWNGYGQTTVPMGTSGVTAIAAGYYHTAALRSDGTVTAWGRNDYGQITVPTGLSEVAAIAAGDYFTVALKSNGTVVAWGYNAHGQTTVPVAAQSGVTAIAAGQNFTVALKNDGTVVAWGYNATGQTNVPAGLSGATAIAAGYNHTVALGPFSAPTITTQPVGQTVVAGQTGSFSAAVTGTAPLNYQWRKDGANLSGATNNTFILTATQTNQAGSYTFVVSNFVGSVTSTPPALLTVITQPQVDTQPIGQIISLAGMAALSVVASGGGLSYQWQVNGTNVPGATNASLTLTNLTALNAGAYRVIVFSAAGAVTSQDANLLFFGDLQFFSGTSAGTVLAGPVGQQFRVDFAEVLNASTTNWLVFTNISLPFSPYLLIDSTSPGKPQRYYRAVPLP